MQCPFCGSFSNKVVDKRAVAYSGEIRRRRECLKCRNRFTTYEKIASLELVVVKKDGRMQPFDREKIKSGVLKALEKRPAVEQAEELVVKVERKIRGKRAKQIQSKAIGRMVLSELKKVDKVAYLRFASVYRGFGSPDDFAKELSIL